MAHLISLATRAARIAAASALLACGDPGPPEAHSPSDALDKGSKGSKSSGAASDYPSDDPSWGKFHSKRFQLTIPLPEGKAWKIDDHRQPELVAVHAKTSSRLSLISTQEDALMNRQRCEDRARALGWIPKSVLTTVDDHEQLGPDGYDSRLWVALDAGRRDGKVEGHVFLFGGFLRRCLLVHLVTTVPSGKDEEVLASRLALASTRIVKALALDPLRTTDDATTPRDKPDIRR